MRRNLDRNQRGPARGAARTHTLLSASPALDAGDAAVCDIGSFEARPALIFAGGFEPREQAATAGNSYRSGRESR